MDIPYNNLVSIANDEDKTRRLKQGPEVQGPALPANFQQPEHIIYANITVDNPLAGYNSGVGPQQAQPTYQQPTVGGNQATQATPEKWYAGDSPTYAEMVAQLYRKKDSLSPEQYNTLAAQIDALKDDPTSGFYYNRYANGPTSPFIEEIAKLGVDVSGGINDEWIAKNQYLLQGARYTDTGTTPAAPTKTSTKEQNLAYYFYQIARNYNDTKEVLQEEDALKKEISYWVGRDDLNLSDDQILEKLDWTKKYKYLQGLKDAATPGTSTTGKQYNYTQAIDYNPDHLRAYIWQARNGGGTGNIELDAVSAALGQGNTWKENKALAAKMNPADYANFSPYSVAATMEDEARLFGVKQFDQDWIDQNRALAYSADAATRNAYANVVKNEQFMQKAETELKTLNESVDTMLAAGLKPDEIMDGILDDYPSLKKLEDSLYSGKGLVETTRPIDFRLQDVKNMVEQEYAAKEAKTNAVDFEAQVNQILNKGVDSSFQPQGNINLYDRIPVVNSDGSISTVDSFSVNIDGQEVLLPTIIAGKRVSQDEALEHYYETGEYLGKFDTVAEADEYAKKLHEQQERLYAGSQPKSTAAPTPILSPAEIAVNLSKDKTLAAAASTLLVTGTEPEKTVMKFAPSIQFPGLLPILAQNIATGTLSGNAGRDFVQKQTDDYTAKNYLSSKKVTDQHDTIQKQQDEMKKEKADLQRVVDLADRANELEALSPYKNPWTPWTIKEINGQVYSLSADYNEKTGKFDVNVSREAASDFNVDIDAVAQKAAEEYLSELNTGVHVKSVDENGEAEYDLGNSLAPKPATRNIAIRADQDLYYVSNLRLQENGEYALGPVARVTQGKDVIPSSFKLIDAWENSPIDADTQKQIDAWASDLGDFSGYAGENGAQIPTLDEADAAREQIKFLNSRIKESQQKLDTMQAEYTRAQEQQKLIKNGAQTAALLDIMNNAPKIDASGFYGHLRMQEQIQAYTDKAMELPRSLDLISKVGSEYRSTEWRAQTIFDELSAMGTSPSEVQEFTYGLIHQSQANLDALDQAVTRAENAGVELDADTKSNLEREKNRLQKEKQDAQDYALRYRSDFDSKVADISADVLAHPEKYKGTFALYAVDPSRDELKTDPFYWLNPSAQLTPQQPTKESRMDELTPEERKTYLYKVGKEGPRAAYAYYDSCVDRAQVRKAIGEQEELAQFAKDYPVLATLSSIMISPASGEGYLYSLASLAAGQDINPYSQFFFNTRAEQTLVSNAREKILSGLDKNSIGYEVAGLVFDGVVSGAKSGVNAALTGPLFGWIGGAAGTFASVAPMALGAGSAGVLDVNARGGKDWQSVLTGTINGLAEGMTEAFTTKNISDAISAGATGVKGFFKKVLGSDLVEETVGETLGDTVNYWSDDWINGKISERQLAIAEYKKTMSDEDAVAAANMDFAKGLIRTAASTLVSTGITSGGSYAAGYASYVADQLSMSQARHTPEAVADAALSQARHTPEAVAATARRVSTLTASLNADATSQSAAIGAVLMPDNATDTDIRTAGAAGIQLSAMLGQQQAVDVVRQVMADASIASEADTDLTAEARAALSVAALGKGEAARVVQEIAETGITGGDTQRLIEAANRDMANPEMARRINQAVRDTRIALRSQELIANGALAGIRPYEAAVKQERAKLREAQARLQDAVEQQRAAGQNLQDTHEQYKAAPGNENLRGAVRRATQDVVNQKKVVGENAQSVQNIEESMKRAEADLENVRDTAMKDVRQQAVADVQAEEQAEAQEAAEAAAQEANATPDRNPNAGTIYTNDQIPVSFHYSLVPVSDLVTSNTDTGEANSAYPAELQPRDRTRQASQDQVAGMVRTLNPARLGESADAQNGAPIVGPDNVVESGNARTMAIRQAMANNPKSAARYTQYLRENAARFGLNPEDVTENSVLVRVRDTDLDRVAFARAANESTTAGYSPSENAQGDAAKLTPRMMELFAPSDTGRLDTTDNHSFVLAFIEDVIPESERGAYMQSDGTISQQGYERIRNAVFQRAYGSTALTQILTEDTDGSSRNVMNALLKAAPRMMALQDAVDQGGVYDVGLAQKIAEAAQRYMQLKNAGMSVNTYLDQIAIPGMQTEDAATQSLMRLFEEYRRSGKKLSEALTNIADAVEDAGDPRAVSFLGQTEAPPLTELIRQGVERMETARRRSTMDAKISTSPTLVGEVPDAPGNNEQGSETPERYSFTIHMPDGQQENVDSGNTGIGLSSANGPQRQFGSNTSQRSNALHESVKKYLRENSDYDPDSNAEQLERAASWVQGHANGADPEGYHGAVAEVQSPDFNFASADGQARMLTLMSMAALQGDVSTETTLADLYNRQGTTIGQALQARQIFNLLTPLGRQAILQKEVDDINKAYADKGKTTRVQLSKETLEAAGKAKTKEDFDRAHKQAWKELNEQMPATWKERLQAWRMLSMLGNPRTHIRNMLGNLMFMPAVKLKNAIGAGIEAATIKPGSGQYKTKSLTVSKANMEFARNDAIQMKDTLTSEDKYNPQQKALQDRKVFGTKDGLFSRTIGKGLQALSDFNSWALEAEDWWALRRHYANALGGWMQANKLTPDTITPQQLNQAREYAINEAQKATYRDANKLASTLAKISREGGAFGWLVDAVLPFKKTPANILKRGLEYSPAGLIRSMTTDLAKLKKYNDYAQGKLDSLPKGALSPTQFIDRLSSGLTGTAITAIGYALTAAGWITVGLNDDDPEDRLEEQAGRQEYALNIKIGDVDVSYTIDWLAPASMPFFVGAALYDQAQRGTENIGQTVDALMGITEPVFNLSMLDGVNSLLDVSQWSGTQPIAQIGEKVASNYLSSFIPTLAGQISRTIDPVRRKSYVESGASLSTWRYAFEQAQNKTPFSVYNIPYRNVWGEEDRSSSWLAAFENLISPGYISTVSPSTIEKELSSLYGETQDANIVPKMPSKTLSVNGSNVKLNAEQYDRYSETRGKMDKSLLEDLVSRPEWAFMTPESKVEMVKDVYTYANEISRAELFPDAYVSKWVANAQKGGDVIGAIMERREEQAKKDYVDGYSKALEKAITDYDAESANVSITALREAGKTDSDIRSSVTRTMKPLYVEAMEKGDTETANAIMRTLIGLPLGKSKYSYADIVKWLK